MTRPLFILLPFVLLLSACVPALESGARPETRASSLPRGFAERRIEADGYTLSAFEKLRAQGQVAAVYIGGKAARGKSGWASWVSFGGGGDENTGMQLAAMDVSPNVIYLSRPCEDGGCGENALSPEAVRAMGKALDALKQRHGFFGFNLIGHGDGAAVAALLAASGREDILSLRTVAGRLDTPPVMAAAPGLARLPQKHFAGQDDRAVPPSVGESFIAATNRPDCVSLTVVPGAAHTKGWAEAWPGLLEQPLEGSCQ